MVGLRERKGSAARAEGKDAERTGTGEGGTGLWTRRKSQGEGQREEWGD